MRSEAQKLKRQFDQKMASGNLGTWVSRGDPSPASPLRDIRQSHQGANDGDGVNNKYLYCKIWQYSFSLAQENIHPCDDGGQNSNATCDTQEIQEEDIKEWISEATLNTEQYAVVDRCTVQWAK